MGKTFLEYIDAFKPKRGIFHWIKWHMGKVPKKPEKILIHNPKVKSYYPTWWNKLSPEELFLLRKNHYESLNLHFRKV